MRVLDITAGKRAIWFDKEFATFVDHRIETKPDVVADSRCLPFQSGTFDLVVFDPPHVNFGANAEMSKTYGHSTTEEIRDFVREGSKEAYRVLKAEGLMALKWNDHDQKLDKILSLMPDFHVLPLLITVSGSWLLYEDLTLDHQNLVVFPTTLFRSTQNVEDECLVLCATL